MTERRVDHARRKRVSAMSPEEMGQALLVSETTGLPNRRAFEEREASPWVAMCDVNGLKALNDGFGYSAGDILIHRLAEVLTSVEVDAYHDKGDEFLCRGNSFQEAKSQTLKGTAHFETATIRRRCSRQSYYDNRGADFCFGIGTNLFEAERSLKNQKQLLKASRSSFPSMF